MRALVVLTLLLAAPVSAQTFGALQQDARPFVPSLEARAMGGAVAAVPSAETAFFYNPAHLAHAEGRLRLTVLGAGVGLSQTVNEAWAYWKDDLQPAVEEGLGEIRENDPERLDALYDEAFEIGRRPTVVRLSAYGPSFSAPVAPGWTAGAGLFGHATTRLQFSDAGARVPYVDLFSQADVIVPLAAAMRIPGAPVPLAVGATASYTRRYLTAKSALVESLDPDEEHLYVLTGSTLALDLGVHAQDVGVRGLDLGGAVYGLLGGGFTYRYGSRIDLTGEGGPDDAAEIEALEARFNERSGAPTLRLGAAYRVPLPENVAPLGLTVAADYVSASSSEYGQAVGAHLRLGAAVDLGKRLAFRTGLSQGRPSVGASLTLPGIRLDYAFFGVEDGRTAGQLPRSNHALQLRFGRF